MKVIKSHTPTKVKALFVPFELTLFFESAEDVRLFCLVLNHAYDDCPLIYMDLYSVEELIETIRNVLDEA